jgi:hypothetical protein
MGASPPQDRMAPRPESETLQSDLGKADVALVTFEGTGPVLHPQWRIVA